jgi:hypothetical protein
MAVAGFSMHLVHHALVPRALLLAVAFEQTSEEGLSLHCQVDVRRLKEALWQRIKQLGNVQRPGSGEEAPPPAHATLRFQVQQLGMIAVALFPSVLITQFSCFGRRRPKPGCPCTGCVQDVKL